MGARVLDPNGKEVTPIMGSYGIGIERILTAAIEQSNDKNGFWLPASIAPFTVVVTVTNVSDPSSPKPAKSWPLNSNPPASTCCSMTATSVPASNSKTRTWWAFLTASTWARRPPRGIVELSTRSTATSMDVALNEVAALVKEWRPGGCLLHRADPGI